MRQSSFQQAFNVGEIGPDAWARSDLAQHSKGCVLAYNMIGRVAGPAGRRPGTWHVGAPKHMNLTGRLVPFRRSSGDALVIELGHLYGRVWTVNGQPVMDGAAPVEFSTVWPETALAGLRWRQSGDVIYFTHRDNLSPRVLRRRSNTVWEFDGLGLSNGPFRAENGDDAHLLYLTGSSLTASKPTFLPGHVGSLWRLRSGDGNPGILSWEPEEENIGLNARRLSNGRVYARTGGSNKAGNTPPIHDSGTVSDGGADWTFLNDGATILAISAVTSPTAATATLHTAPVEGLDTGTRYWSEPAYSDARGWPTANPAIREERLALAGGGGEPDVVNLTRTGGYSATSADFTPGLGTGRVVDDDAVRRFIGERDRVVWMEGSTFLMAGTTDGEYLITGATVDDPISPAGTVARPVGEFGSADVMPAVAFGGMLFVAAGGETLRRLKIDPDQGMDKRDLSVVAEHITQRGLAELTWLKQPLNFAWIRLADGGQASFTYHEEQQVEGWNRHGLAALDMPTEEEPLGGGLVLESSCVVPGLNGRPRLFMLVRRQKDGTPQRMLLRMADREDRLFLDAAESYLGDAVNGLAGLDHLAGETATVMAATEADASDTPGRGWGEYRARPVASGGVVNLPETVQATRAYAGLPYLSRWEGLPPDMGGPGASAGRKVDYKHVTVVIEAAEAYVGSTGDEGDSGTDRFLSRDPGDVGGPAVRRKAWRAAVLGGASPDRRYFVETRSGWDMVIHAIRATAEVNG